MKAFGNLLPCQHVICYAHTIHLAVVDVLYKKNNVEFEVSNNNGETKGEADDHDSDEESEEAGDAQFVFQDAAL